MPRFDPRIRTGMTGVYVLDNDALDETMRLIWRDISDGTHGDDYREAVMKRAGNTLLGVRWFYGIRRYLPTMRCKRTVTFAGDDVDLRSNWACYLSQEFVTVNLGSINLEKQPWYTDEYQNVSYKAYLPFVGLVDLDVRDTLGSYLTLAYRVNLTDGSALCSLNDYWTNTTIFTAPCQWGYDVPFRVTPKRTLLSDLLRTAVQCGARKGGPKYTSGQLTPNTGALGGLRGYLYVYRNRAEGYEGDNKQSIGLPCSATLKVGEATGYLKINTVYGSSDLPPRHYGEIIEKLKEGVYI